MLRVPCSCRPAAPIIGLIPKASFSAAVAAGKVYKLLGKEDLGTDVWPAATQPIFHDLSYYMHDGGHGMVASDWAIYLEFLKKTFHTEQ